MSTEITEIGTCQRLFVNGTRVHSESRTTEAARRTARSKHIIVDSVGII
jgi:hypothetical protein